MSPRTVHLLAREAALRLAEDQEIALLAAVRTESQQPEAEPAAVRYLFPVPWPLKLPPWKRNRKPEPAKCDCGCGERQTG